MGRYDVRARYAKDASGFWYGISLITKTKVELIKTNEI